MKAYFLIFLVGCCGLFGYYPNFNDNPLLSKEMKQKMAPHLLPLNHPVKPILDQIFSQSRVTDNKQSILDAGFTIIAEMPRSFTFVVRHPLVEGYVFKIHLDSEKKGRYGTPSWEWLTLRCVRAKKIIDLIHKYGMIHFSVPDKWLYPLPLNQNPKRKNAQPVVLLATDMELTSLDESRAAWKTLANPRLLDELYIILHAGYSSSQLASNIPYSKNGTFAFTDTEKEPYALRRVTRYLSKEMQAYWKSITY